MKTWIALGLVSIVAIVLGLTSLRLWEGYSSIKKLNESYQESLGQSNLEIDRGRTIIGSLESSIELLDAQVKKDIEERNSLVTEVAHWKALYNPDPVEFKTVTKVEIKEKIVAVPAELNLEPNHFYLSYSSTELQDIGMVLPFMFQDFRLNINGQLSIESHGEGLIGINTKGRYDLSLSIEGVLTETLRKDGISDYYVSLYELDPKGNRIGKMKLTTFNVVKSDRNLKTFSWFKPKIDLGLFGSMERNLDLHFGGSAGISLMAYGLTDIDLDWRFIRLGLSLTDSLQFDVSPAGYNLGQILPVVTNIWLFPYVGVPVFHPLNYGLMVSVML